MSGDHAKAVLTDNPEDGYVEEFAWLPVNIAPTEDDAIQIVAGAYPLEEEIYCVNGRCFLRPREAVEVDGGWFIFDDSADERRAGRKGFFSTGRAWEKCQDGDDGAIEHWELHVDLPGDED